MLPVLADLLTSLCSSVIEQRSLSITADIFATLGILVLERVEFDLFKIVGILPDWVETFYCLTSLDNETLIPQEKFPFMENFLIDAEEFWQKKEGEILKSGLWCQTDISNQEFYFEASAVCINAKQILLIELLKDDFQERQYILQKARENLLNHQNTLKENQKKEILIHCIIHDVAGQLSVINHHLSILAAESLTSEGRESLELARKQTLKQEKLIRETLEVFSAEVQSLQSFTTYTKYAPDVLVSVQEVIEVLTPCFVLNNIQLQLRLANDDKTIAWKVVGDKSRLDRILANLTENAFRHSPPGSTVTINLKQDEKDIIVTIDDEGIGISPEDTGTLFQKFSQSNEQSGKAGLGLYFCRITVERWGGAIGYLPRPEGGSQFWFRLPKASLEGE